MALGQRRYTIERLMIVVALVGTSVSALVRPNQGWAIILPSLFPTLLLTALLGVLLRRGLKRASWVGVTLFGWAYMATLAFWRQDIQSPCSLGPVVARRLAGPLEILIVLGLWDEVHLADLPCALGQVDDESRFVVVYSIMGLLFARLGGLIARSLSGDDRPQNGLGRPGIEPSGSG
jgi:hypothetical protein